MANENETVEQVCDKMDKEADGTYIDGCGLPSRDIGDYKDRILAAHKREIADFQRRYDECVRRFNEADLERVRLRDEVAAKDAEILSLKQKIDEYERQPELMADTATKALELLKRQDAEIASLRETIKRFEHENTELFIKIDLLRSLVNELADVIEDADSNIGSCRGEFQRNYIHKKRCALVARAREATNG